MYSITSQDKVGSGPTSLCIMGDVAQITFNGWHHLHPSQSAPSAFLPFGLWIFPFGLRPLSFSLHYVLPIIPASVFEPLKPT